MSKTHKNVSKLNFVKIGNSANRINSGQSQNSNINRPPNSESGENSRNLGNKETFQISDFLNKIQFPFNKKNETHADNLSFQSENYSKSSVNYDSGLKSLPFAGITNNPNSIGSVFSSNYSEVSGVNRVFRKSLSFLIVHLVFFLGLVLVGLNFFNFNPVISIFLIVLNIAIANIFYIIVADRSYVWLSLAGQAITIVFINSFYGLGFDSITLIITLLAILFSYLAYSELEKVQLSSRLFSISHITTESTRIFLTVSALIISLGVYNSIVFEGIKNNDLGSRPFLSRTFFDNKLIMNNLLIGKTRSLALNTYLLKGGLYKDGQKVVYNTVTKTGPSTKQATFGYFLEKNYELSEVLNAKEEDDLRSQKCNGKPESTDCDKLINQEINKRLEDWGRDIFNLQPNQPLPYKLDTLLITSNYSDIIKNYYLQKIEEFETKKSEENGLIPVDLILIPLKNIIPAMIAVVVFLILFLLKFFLAFLVLIFTWIIWKVLNMIGFVQIDVETVEAEIVSI